MKSLYPIIAGTALFLVGILGWIFRESFGTIPTYHLVADIVIGLWWMVIGFSAQKPKKPNDF